MANGRSISEPTRRAISTKPVMSLDEAEAIFIRRPETIDPKLKTQFGGMYQTPGGGRVEVVLAADGKLSLAAPGQPPIPLTQVKGLIFKTPYFRDVTLEFLVQDGKVTGIKQKDPSGELTFPKR